MAVKLIWADECSGAAGAPPDPALWGVRETDRWQPAGEAQTYTRDPANAHYDGDGHLVIRAARQDRAGRRYTSGRLSARHSTSGSLFRYGRFAARMRVPTAPGVWPAFWLLGEDDRYGWPGCGEIDIMEAPASAGTTGQIHQGVHCPPAGGGAGAGAATAGAAAPGAVSVGVPPSTGEWGTGFHTYAARWTPGRIEFLIDDRPTGSVDAAQVRAAAGTWPFDDRPQSPIVNLAVGGWAGEPDGTWSEQLMLIEWVRVYAGST